MNLLCDEDIGTGVPKALTLVGCKAKSLYALRMGGKSDEFWLTKAGQNGWLAFSENKKILKVPSERDTIIREKVGIVFLTNGSEYNRNVLRLLLANWDALELIWDTVDRPFVRFMLPKGKIIEKYKDYSLF